MSGVFAIFIDGPLAGETRFLPPHCVVAPYRVPLPRRDVVCWCDGYEQINTRGPEIFEYNLIAKGEGIALYSKYKSGEELVKTSLLNFVHTDFSNLDRLIYRCRDRRAYL